jgi:hypothetical protein
LNLQPITEGISGGFLLDNSGSGIDSSTATMFAEFGHVTSPQWRVIGKLTLDMSLGGEGKRV